MKVINTTNKDIEVVIKGRKYFLPANGSVSNVPEAHALHWKTKVHHFLNIAEDSVEDKESPAAEKQKKIEEETAEKEVSSLRERYNKFFGKEASPRMKDETIKARVEKAEKEASEEEFSEEESNEE